ncbi:MAG: hypothetical protein IJ068_00360 [Bacilli bacterium]|nr:hypothetical protein [Bacilli bacterium]
MARYIDVEVSLKKTIKVENDNLNVAIEIAQENFPKLESTSEWLDARKITYKENVLITPSAETLAKLFYQDFNMEKLIEFVEITFRDDNVKKFIFDETIEILKYKYNLEINKINI